MGRTMLNARRELVFKTRSVAVEELEADLGALVRAQKVVTQIRKAAGNVKDTVASVPLTSTLSKRQNSLATSLATRLTCVARADAPSNVTDPQSIAASSRNVGGGSAMTRARRVIDGECSRGVTVT